MSCTGQYIEVPVAPLYTETASCRTITGKKTKSVPIYTEDKKLYVNKHDLDYGKFYSGFIELDKTIDCGGKPQKIQKLIWEDTWADEKTKTTYEIKDYKNKYNPYLKFNVSVIVTLIILLILGILGLVLFSVLFVKDIIPKKNGVDGIN